MKLPDCFYQKAFWIVIPILITSTGSGLLALNNQIMALDEAIDKNAVQIATNNVPELKETIKGIDMKLDNLIVSQARIEGKIDQLDP